MVELSMDGCGKVAPKKNRLFVVGVLRCMKEGKAASIWVAAFLPTGSESDGWIPEFANAV